MEKLEPIDWDGLNAAVGRLQVIDAVTVICEQFAKKINELVEAYNESE